MLHELIYDQLKTILDDVYPGVVAEEVSLPYIAHFNVSNIPSPDADQEGSKMDVIRWQVSCFHNSFANVVSLADSVRTALDEFSGSGHDVTVTRCLFAGENYIYEANRVHHIAVDFDIRLKR